MMWDITTNEHTFFRITIKINRLLIPKEKYIKYKNILKIMNILISFLNRILVK